MWKTKLHFSASPSFTFARILWEYKREDSFNLISNTISLRLPWLFVCTLLKSRFQTMTVVMNMLSNTNNYKISKCIIKEEHLKKITMLSLVLNNCSPYSTITRELIFYAETHFSLACPPLCDVRLKGREVCLLDSIFLSNLISPLWLGLCKHNLNCIQIFASINLFFKNEFYR